MYVSIQPKFIYSHINRRGSRGFMGKNLHCINSASSNSKTEVTLAMLHGVWLWKFITKLDDPGKTDKRHYYCACVHTRDAHISQLGRHAEQ